jgi:hypothetical protein
MSVRRTTVFLAAAATAVVLALSGCGSSQQDSPSSSNKQAAPEAAAPQQGAGAGAAADQPQDAQQKAPDNVDVENRSIIYTGTMTLRVKNVDAAAAQAIGYATGAGGFIGGDQRHTDGLSSSGTLTLRVPAAKFNSVLDLLKGVGDEKDRQVSAQDVTDQVADVDSRIKTAQASVERIRALMARAQTIGEITSLESELSRRESDLESLQARKRRLDGLTALSTITVVLLGPEAPVSKEDTGIMVGLRNGWSAFTASLRVALTVLGWLLPWILFVGVPIYVLVWAVRRYRPRRPVALAPAGVPLPPAPFPVPPMSPVPGRIAPPRHGFVPPAGAPVGRPAGAPPAGPPSARPVGAPAGPTGAAPAGAPAGNAPVSGPPKGEVPGDSVPGGDPAVSEPGAGAEAQPRRAPEDAAPQRPQPTDEGPSGPSSAR